MAYYIKIQKTFEDSVMARYVFESNPECKGMFAFDKLTGEATLVEPMFGDERGQCFSRASVKVAREWRNGRLPDLTEWAS